jgi:SAM-dependent methyltransferase
MVDIRHLVRSSVLSDAPPNARGNFEFLDVQHDSIAGGGWMFLPGALSDGFELRIDDVPVPGIEKVARPDVLSAFPAFPEAIASGFHFHLPQDSPLDRFRTIDVYAMRGSARLARMSILAIRGFSDGVAEPPEALRVRVANTPQLVNFRVTGLQTFSQFAEAIGRHADVAAIGTMLDWGCGCGRVTPYFVKYSGIGQIHACDIDAQSIAFCREYLHGATFRTITPYPPTSYEDGMFDLVTGYSVMTHLTRESQAAWLQELHRIQRPGALCLLTLHGEGASEFLGPEFLRRLQQAGIDDGTLDPALDSVAPAGYYRATYQSRDYTLREFSKFFEVLEYVDRGMFFQDLVVLRRKPGN